MVQHAVTRMFICLIRCYQVVLSPLFPTSCRFFPTCSEYAIEAIGRHGPMKGLGSGSGEFSDVIPFTPADSIPWPNPAGSHLGGFFMDKRTLIAIVLSLALVMLYQYLFVKPVAVQKPADQAKQETAVSATTTPGATPEATSGPETPIRQRSLFKREEAVVPGKDITVDTPCTPPCSAPGAGRSAP